MKFRKKPVVIEAFRLGSHEIPNWAKHLTFIYCEYPERGIEAQIPTLEGTMLALSGDWIIKGISGELYPCKPDIFEMTYEAVE